MLSIAIAGGGAAGHFAAIRAKECCPTATVYIIEKTKHVLSKVAITGGGRCNLTNTFADVSDLKKVYPRGANLMKRLFNIFNNDTVIKWFEIRGIKFYEEEEGKIFPQSDDANEIVNCLKNEAKKNGVKTITSKYLLDIEPESNGRIKLYFKDNTSLTFDKVIITTGGSPKYESLKCYERLGHKIEKPLPSLFTFNICDKRLLSLMGTVINNVILSLPGTKLKSKGTLLITHWGISGPATLKLSSYAAKYLYENEYNTKVSINWLASDMLEAQNIIQNISKTNKKKQIGNTHPQSLTSRVWIYLIERCGIDTKKNWEILSKKEYNKLVECLTNDLYSINGRGTYKDEFVTCGGISLSDINMSTLESRIVPNLYFAGEILDIDAITGGYNLQAAWTTGYVSGTSATTIGK